MYTMKNYKNNLKSASFKRMNVVDYENFLYPTEVHQNCESVVKSFENVLDYYKEYIQDYKKVVELFTKIDSLQYTNAGQFTVDGWKHNKHIFVINEKIFEYSTGVGINCTEKSGTYNYYKLILDAIYMFLSDAYYGLNYSEDDFISELGYEENVKSYKKGIKAYNACKEIAEKCISIWGKDTINNIYDIIQL